MFSIFTKERTLGILGWMAVFCLLFKYFFHYFSLLPPNNDDATLVMISKDYFNGNIVLNGWVVGGDDGLWKFKQLLYAILIKFLGVRPGIVDFVKTLVFSLTVVEILYLINVKIYKFGLKNLLLILPFLLFPNSFLFYQIVYGDHWGATFLLLLSLIFSRKYLASEKGGLYLFLIFVVLLIGAIGDPILLYVGMVPILCALIVEILIFEYARRNFKNYILLLTIVASIFSYGYLKNYIFSHSSLVVAKSPANFIGLEEIGQNFYIAMKSILAFFDSNFFGKPLVDLETLGCLINFSYLLILVLFFFRVAKKNLAHGDRDEFVLRALIYCVMFNVFAFLFSTQPANIYSSRYLVIAFIGLLIVAAHFRPQIPFVRYAFLLYLLALSFHAYRVFSLYAYSDFAMRLQFQSMVSSLSYIAFDPGPVGVLQDYLGSKNIRSIYAPNDFTPIYLSSRGAISVRPVLCFHNDVTPFYYGGKLEWYKDWGRTNYPFTIVLIKGHGFTETADTSALNIQCAQKAFGDPDRINHIGKFLVLRWNKVDYSQKINTFWDELRKIKIFSDRIDGMPAADFNFKFAIQNGLLKPQTGFIPKHPRWSPEGLYLTQGPCLSDPKRQCRFAGVLGNSFFLQELDKEISSEFKEKKILIPKHLWPYPGLGGTIEETTQNVLLVEMGHENPKNEKNGS